MEKAPFERSFENEAAMIAVIVERALGKHQGGAGEPAVRGRDRNRLQPLIVADAVDERRQTEGPRRGIGHIGCHGEQADSRGLLEGNQRRQGALALDKTQALGVALALGGHRPAIVAEHRRDHGRLDAGEPVIVLDQARGEPLAGVGDGVERPAVGGEVEAGPGTEVGNGRGEGEAAQKLQGAEAGGGIADLERLDGSGADLERDEAGGAGRG